MQATLQKTPLYDNHTSLDARIVEFGGWAMPVQYDGILAEYKQTRTHTALFDISHMGEFIMEGDCVEIGLDRLVTSAIADMPIKSCRYGAMLNEQGGVLDDLIVFRIEKEKWFIVVNASTTEKDAQHIQKHLKPGTTFQDVSLKTGKIDIQGPLAREVLSPLAPGIEKLNFYTFDHFDLLGQHVLISRTGYTGELGYEIYFPWEHTPELWQKLLEHKHVKPAGLGARDLLRLEVGYSLYGHELDENTSVLESGLNRFIDFKKNFFGKESLLKQKESGLKRKLIGFIADSRRSPRQGHKIYSESQDEIGEVTSGSFSPHLQKGIGLGFVLTEEGIRDKKIFFGNDKNKIPAIITPKIFYKNGSLKD